MAQDPDPPQGEEVNPSSDLDMVPVYTSQNVDADVEAEVIKSILVANGVPTILVRSTAIPPLGFEIQVPRAMADEARRIIEEQRRAGPEAAVEAEAASERPGREEPD